MLLSEAQYEDEAPKVPDQPTSTQQEIEQHTPIQQATSITSDSPVVSIPKSPNYQQKPQTTFPAASIADIKPALEVQPAQIISPYNQKVEISKGRKPVDSRVAPSLKNKTQLTTVRVSRPREKVVQEEASENFLRNFPEIAAPEGGDVPIEEQLAIREALFELKKTGGKRSF